MADFVGVLRVEFMLWSSEIEFYESENCSLTQYS